VWPLRSVVIRTKIIIMGDMMMEDDHCRTLMPLPWMTRFPLPSMWGLLERMSYPGTGEGRTVKVRVPVPLPEVEVHGEVHLGISAETPTRHMSLH